MKLLLNATSPFARLVRIVMLEKGLEEQIELVWSDPWGEDPFLMETNPLGRIPALVCDSGTTLCESHLIASYLDNEFPGKALIPGDQKESVLYLAGLGQGLMEAAFSTVISRKYLNEEANQSVLSELRWAAIHRTLEQLEVNIDQHSSPDVLTLGDITVAVALDYIIFRLSELDTAHKYPKLEAWRAALAERSSFSSTAFQ